MAKVVEISESELQERRSALLASVALSYEELEAGARLGLLTEAERDVWERLQTIAFLLGE